MLFNIQIFLIFIKQHYVVVVFVSYILYRTVAVLQQIAVLCLVLIKLMFTTRQTIALRVDARSTNHKRNAINEDARGAGKFVLVRRSSCCYRCRKRRRRLHSTRTHSCLQGRLCVESRRKESRGAIRRVFVAQGSAPRGLFLKSLG